MGSCISKKSSIPQRVPTVENDEEYEGVPMINFNIGISKIKVRELNSTSLKAKKVSIEVRLKEKLIVFQETSMVDGILRWPDTQSCTYETSLTSMNREKIEILLMANKKMICYCEISIKSIIDGPVQQNMSLFSNGLIFGRISFEIEMLEVSTLKILPTEIKCDLGEENVGNFSVSLRFASDFLRESEESYISENPTWTFVPTQQSEIPELTMKVTMKTIRDAALQIRLYKHHKSEKELVAECWLSFTKLFAEDMEAIYRTESFLASRESDQTTKLDFEKLIKNMKRVHHKKINDTLWHFGRKIGIVTGAIKLSGIPTFVQLISGVNTEKGYSIQSTVYSDDVGNKGKEKIPKKIMEIMKITRELEDSIHFKPGKGGIAYEKEMLEKKKRMFQELFEKLQSSQKDSMVCFLYKNKKSLIKAQEALIHLGNHLVEYAKLVNYDIKPSYFLCLTYLVKRGELDIGFLSSQDDDQLILPLKVKVAQNYLKFLLNVVQLSLSRMAFKGVDKLTEEFVYVSLAISWFRIPDLREELIKLIKEKSYYSIEEWRKTDTDLDDEKGRDLSAVLDWKTFYALIPEKSVKFDSFIGALMQENWRQKMQKRGIAFFSFLKYWINHIHQQTARQQKFWSSITGYKVLLKAFLIEMKERPIIEYPEALIECAAALLKNPKLLNVMVRIVFSKTNIYDYSAVQECYRFLDVIFTEVYSNNRKLPPTFDSEFFYKGIEISLDDENGLNVAKCISFLYNQYHVIRGHLREKIVLKIIITKKLKKFFFHWCRDLRRMLHYLILYRIYSMKKLNFEVEEEDNSLGQKIVEKCKKKVKAFKKEDLKSEQKPYFDASMKEFGELRVEYKQWKGKIPTDSGKLFGYSDTFPYPIVNIKLNFFDLAEKKLEERW